MGSEGPTTTTKKVVINVSGFKKFQGVTENPTETIVTNLRTYLEKNQGPSNGLSLTLGSCIILETAGDGACDDLYKAMELGIQNVETSSADDQVVWLHLGVNSGASKFAIERKAANEATFCCADEFGWQPQKIPIVEEDGEISRARETSCSIGAIHKILKKRFNVSISDDAGRFVCNYVYYHSLRFAEEKGHKSLFVHVPLFTRVDEESQMRFVASLLQAISETC